MTRPSLDFAALKRRLASFDRAGKTFYVAEGDLLLDEEQLRQYADGEPGSGRAPLLGMAQNGVPVRWPKGTVLSYWVDPQGFSDERRRLVSDNLARATGDWQAACDVAFKAQSAREGALFVVQHEDARGAFLASSFFPNDPDDRRQLVIDPSYFASRLQFDRAGILRHELGHVLGFRHENIRSGAPALCPREDLDDTLQLTDYDPGSVMHYFCGGVGSKTLELTASDRSGACALYGAPR